MKETAWAEHRTQSRDRQVTMTRILGCMKTSAEGRNFLKDSLEPDFDILNFILKKKIEFYG